MPISKKKSEHQSDSLDGKIVTRGQKYYQPKVSEKIKQSNYIKQKDASLE